MLNGRNEKMKKVRTAKKLVEQYIKILQDKKALESVEKELKGEIIALMEGDSDTIGSYIIKNTPVESMRMDAKRAREELGDDVYTSLCKKVISHRFTVSI